MNLLNVKVGDPAFARPNIVYHLLLVLVDALQALEPDAQVWMHILDERWLLVKNLTDDHVLDIQIAEGRSGFIGLSSDGFAVWDRQIPVGRFRQVQAEIFQEADMGGLIEALLRVVEEQIADGYNGCDLPERFAKVKPILTAVAEEETDLRGMLAVYPFNREDLPPEYVTLRVVNGEVVAWETHHS